MFFNTKKSAKIRLIRPYDEVLMENNYFYTSKLIMNIWILN